MAQEHDDKRLQIITLMEHGNFSMREIARRLNCDHKTVSRTWQRYQESGDHRTLYGNCGRPPKFDERQMRQIKRSCVASPRSSAADLLNQIGASGDCSVRTMQRTLNKIGCKAVKPGRRPYLNDNQVRRRLQWAREHQHWTVDDWKQVLFTDETVIELRDEVPQYVRVVDGHELTPEHFIRTTKHPTSIMVWGCFSWEGPGRVHVVERTMNSEVYIQEIIDRRIVFQMNDLFPEGNGWLQQDNAPCHTSKRSMAHFYSKGIRVLPWPPSSPDANPIENLWSVIKRRLKTRGCKNKPDLVNAFINVWARDPEIAQICKTLVESMPERVEAIIKNKGGATRY